MNNSPVGVFDSGVGGLTVAREIVRQLPNESFVYFGDNGRNPYGTRSMEQVAEFSAQICRFLLTHDVKAIVIACNTATIASMPALQAKVSVPVIGVVDASVKVAPTVTKNGKIGVLATDGSIKSQAFHKMLKSEQADLEITGVGCPLLVQLAEGSIFSGADVSAALDEYLTPMKAANVDTIILGCTHFPLFADMIQAKMGGGVTLVDPAKNVLRTLQSILQESDSLADGKGRKYSFYSSAKDNANFAKICNNIFGYDCAINYVDIDGY